MSDPAGRLNEALAGRYRIEREIGAGGMATVYLARDVKHDRLVALKVLRPELSAVLGGGRFLAEIRVTARLQHPHILPLFDSGEAAGLLYYVMPYVEGESLRGRLEREKQLGVEEAVRLAGEVASALDHAHHQGVIHRDIKPENILIRDGQALVADFGIALALRTAGAERLTGTGLSLGTPQYMSPEQAMSDRELDARTDIYSLGCVLYEMLAGAPPHTGPTVQAVLSKVLTADPPPIAELRRTVPAHVAAALERALAKLPADRFATAGEFGDALAGRLAFLPGRAPAAVAGRVAHRRRLAARGAALAGLVLLAAGLGRFTADRRTDPTGPETSAMPVRLTVPVPGGFTLYQGIETGLAISPDGSLLAFRADDRIYLRRIGEDFRARPVPGTENGLAAFFSPDGAWLGFTTPSGVWKAAVAGGPAVRIVAATPFGGAAWGPDGRIVYSTGYIAPGLWSVSEDGGEPTLITTVAETMDETAHLWPHFLPDGSLLYTALGLAMRAHDARLWVQDLASGTRELVATGVSYGRYAGGHLAYVSGDGTLSLQPYDVGARRTTGPARAVLGDIRVGTTFAGKAYDLSRSGTLVYATGSELEESLFVEVDRQGTVLRRFGSPQSMWLPALSPDGRTLAMSLLSRSSNDIGLLDLPTGSFSKFTTDLAHEMTPVWSPDATRIAWSAAAPGGRRHVYVKGFGAGERPRLLWTAPGYVQVSSWSPDGEWLALTQWGVDGSMAVLLLNVRDPERVVRLPQFGAQTGMAVFAPAAGGEWIAYHANDPDPTRFEVYVAPVVEPSARHLVSRAGGSLPRWSADGLELYFWDGSLAARGRMMVARRASATAVSWTEPEPLFEVERAYPFAVAADGQSFYIVAPNPDNAAGEICVVHNWLADVVRGAGTRAGQDPSPSGC